MRTGLVLVEFRVAIVDVISVINQKGGSGKTTVALHTGVVAAEKGRVVSLLDLDPQRSAGQWWDLRDARERPTDFTIAPCKPSVLIRSIEMARETDSDLVIVDTPPQANRTMIHAAEIADLVVIPSKTTAIDEFALRGTLELLDEAKVLGKCVVLINGHRGPDQKAIAKVRATAKAFKVPVATAMLPENVDFGRALDAGLGVTEYRAKGRAALSVAAVYREIVRRLAVHNRSPRRRHK